jgi:hypothetical protein
MVAAAVLSLWIASPLPAFAQTRTSAAKSKQPTETAGPADYRSKNFLVHTDLSADEAKELLTKLETMLALISRYWGKPNTQMIECYVVKDLAKWPPGSLDPRGVESIRTGGGVTLSTTLTRGNAFVAKAIVYAGADRGTPQHEAVHAYCSQMFGTTGPIWYSEGMAEMGNYWRENDASVEIHPGVLEYLQTSEPKSLNGIVNNDEATGDSWENYAWRWALCHLLANNPNYAPRFRPLGLSMLTKQDATFEQVYGSMADEVSFEYLFFLKHLDHGYRVDLCSWDWKAKFLRPRGKTSMLAKIEAGRGWQPSRVLVKEGEEYEFSADGTWTTTKDGTAVDADGEESGAGKLVGILFHEYQLSEPFELGVYGSFTAPSDGNLLLRCHDQWGEIADNTGRMTVKIKAKDPNAPLPNPKQR